MEESEKRRERLKAMRLEAASATSTATVPQISDAETRSPFAQQLSNPLLESPSSASVTPSPSLSFSRFDYYTDPMSAFTGSNKRNNHPHHGSRNFNTSPAPIQFQMNSSPGQWSYETPSPRPLSYSGRNQIGIPSPFSGHPETPAANLGPNFNTSPAPIQFQMNSSPGQWSYGTPSPRPMSYSGRSQIGIPSPFSGHPEIPAADPGSWNKMGGSPGYGRGGYHNAGYGRGPSPRTKSGRGNDYHYNNSPSSSSSGLNGGRGQGSNAHISAWGQRNSFYKKSMVEDPWKFLKPVVGSALSKSWLPNSLRKKKAKFSEDAFEFSSQQSLADCFSLAVQDAREDAANA